MSLLAVFILTLSAVAHAGWNMFAKRASHSGLAFYGVACSAAACFASPGFLCGWNWMTELPARFGWLVLGSGVAQAMYLCSLTQAYRYGGLGLSYPVARALPVLLVPLGSLLLFSHVPPLGVAVGMGLVAVGMLMLARAGSGHGHRGLALGWAGIASLGTVIYSLLDYQALQLLQMLHPVLPRWQLTAFYAACQAWSAFLMVALLLVPRAQRRRVTELLQQRRLATLGAGVVIFLTYALVMLSYLFVRDVSYAVAFRQLSIPIGVAFGAFFLREPLGRMAVIANGILLCGLLMVVLGG